MPAPQAVIDLIQRYEFNRIVYHKGQKNENNLKIRQSNNRGFQKKSFLSGAYIHR
jgi:hypothetical protein